ncbi:MAG: hypothetical protein AAFX65_12400 [Cyanobacteria bacterium J06638_7]
MIELPATGLTVTSYQVLAGIASALLVFVSAGVIYLSAAEWRDRRRRRASESAARPSRAGRADRPDTGGPPRAPAAFGRRP